MLLITCNEASITMLGVCKLFKSFCADFNGTNEDWGQLIYALFIIYVSFVRQSMSHRFTSLSL